MHLRSEHPPLCGRDHLSFRSYYFPVKVGLCWKYGLNRGIVSPLNKVFSLVASLPPLKNQNGPHWLPAPYPACPLGCQVLPQPGPLAYRLHPSAWPWNGMDWWWWWWSVAWGWSITQIVGGEWSWSSDQLEVSEQKMTKLWVLDEFLMKHWSKLGF